MKKRLIKDVVAEAISGINVGDSIDKNELILSIYGRNDVWVSRSFDVHFAKAKKMFPDRKFKSVMTKEIIRIS